MRTAKCVTLSVVVALAGIAAIAVEAGQDNSAKPPQAPPRELSGTRLASCVVRITADPTLVPLSLDTVRGMVYSSGVAGKAAREVLHGDLLGDAERLLQIEWLDASPAGPSPAARPINESYDNEMMRELQRIYGEDYMKQFGVSGGRKGETEEKQAPNPSPEDRSRGSGNVGNHVPGTSDQPRSGTATAMGVYGMGGYGVTMGGMMPGMGGYGGGMGMGGMGGMMPGMGGYGGGMGMGGMGGMMGRAEQTAVIRLSVGLPNDMVPVANEFLEAVVTNLDAALTKAYDNHVRNLRELLTRVEDQRRRAEAAVRGATDDTPELTVRVKEQLNTIVDFPVNPQMPAAEAVEMLRRSVAPPLNIVVLWSELSLLSIDPSTPINIDGMTSVRLETALDLLVKGLPTHGDKPVWKIKGNVIVIGMAVTLDGPDKPVGTRKVETDARTLATQKNELERNVQSLELELAGQEARRRATEEQIQRARIMADEKLAQDPVTQELQKLVEINTVNLATLRKQVDSGRLSPAELAKAEESLTRAKIELAQRREELGKQVGGGQLEQFNGELARMAIDRAEKQTQLEILSKQLQDVQQQLAQASVFDPQAARMRIAQEALDITARRIAELQMRLANLQPPTVNVIGAN
jgi:hypothetical protein